MDILTEREKNIAKTAEKSTTGKSSSKSVASKQDEKRTAKVLPVDLSKVDPKKIKMAEELGIPVGQILNWMGTVEARFQALEQNLPKEIQDAMIQAIEEDRKKQVEQYQKAMADGKVPQSQGGDSGMIQNLIMRALVGGGGGGSSEFDKMLREMGMENMLLGREIIRQTFTRGAKDILDRVDSKMAEFRAKKTSSE